jgi:HEAT repeat protein
LPNSEFLRSVLRNEKPDKDRTQSDEFWKHATEEDVASLMEISHCEDAFLRNEALDRLSKIRASHTEDAIGAPSSETMEIAEDEPEGSVEAGVLATRLEAIQEDAPAGQKYGPDQTSDVVEQENRRALQSEDTFLRGSAYERLIAALAEGEALDLVRAGLGDKSADVRRDVVAAAEERARDAENGTMFIEALAQHLPDESDRDVREGILRMLSYVEDDRYQVTFIDALKDAEKSEQTTEAALNYLSRHPHINAREPVLAYLRTGEVDQFRLVEAINIIGQAGTPEDARLIASYATHPYEYVRAAVAHQLGRLAPAEHRDALEALAKDSEEPVATAAQSAPFWILPTQERTGELLTLLTRVTDPWEQFKILDQLLEVGADEEVKSFLLKNYSAFKNFPRREAWQRLLKLGIYVPTPNYEPNEQPWRDLARKAQVVRIKIDGE